MNINYIRRCITSLAVVAASVGLASAADVNVCLHLTTGEKVYFYFEDHPVMSFDGSSVTMSHKDSQVKVLDCAALHKVTFDDNSGVAAVAAPAGTVSARAGVVTLAGFPAGTCVTVVSASGVAVYTGGTVADDVTTVDLTAHAPGVYIVNAGSLSCKITNR